MECASDPPARGDNAQTSPPRPHAAAATKTISTAAPPRLCHSGPSREESASEHPVIGGRGTPGPAKSAASAAPLVLQLDNSKAGMANVDRGKVEAVINAMSAGTPFYMNEERKAANRRKRIESLLVKYNEYALRSDMHRRVEEEVAAMVDDIESKRRLGCFIHLDMDGFYAACEEREHPALANVPMAVGSIGMLSTSNYVARRYGVRAAMPGYIAKKLCPELIIIHPNFDLYKAVAEQVRAIAAQYDPSFVSLGLDELTVDVSRWEHRGDVELPAEGEVPGLIAAPASSLAAAAAVAAELRIGSRLACLIRRQITEVTRLTASAGIAPTPTLAKICSNFNKPNGQYELMAPTRDDVVAFVSPLSVRKIPGIGKATEEMLTAFGVSTCVDIFSHRHALRYALTEKTYEFLLESSLGVSAHLSGFGCADEKVEADGGGGSDGSREPSGRRSVGHEQTFGRLASMADLLALAHRLVEKSAKVLVEEGLQASQATVKLKYVSFVVKQHTMNLAAGPSQDLDVLWSSGIEPLIKECLPGDAFATLRLFGVRFTGLGALRTTEAAVNDEALPPVVEPDGRHHFQQSTLMACWNRARKLRNRPAKRQRVEEKRCTNSTVGEVVVVSDGSDGDADCYSTAPSTRSSSSSRDDARGDCGPTVTRKTTEARASMSSPSRKASAAMATRVVGEVVVEVLSLSPPDATGRAPTAQLQPDVVPASATRSVVVLDVDSENLES